MNAVDALLKGLIDYAGLFPPASEDMRPALENYALYTRGRDKRTLGRFIVPMARLQELEKEGSDLMPRGKKFVPWHLSVLVAEDVPAAVEEISRFNRDHSAGSRHGHASIDVVELKATTPADIAHQHRDLPPTLTAYFEIPLSGDLPALVGMMARLGTRAKIRTGGVSPEAFPTAEALADFLVAFGQGHVPFKATAGLHHPIRGDYRLTYEPDSTQCSMYGFLNVFLAATLVYSGESEETCLAMLKENDGSALTFGDDAIGWRDKRIAADQIAASRSEFAIAFGSCSFREPVDELANLTRTSRAKDK